MRVLVTGSLGTLGTPLVAELEDRGHAVWGCYWRHTGDDYFIRADVADYRQLAHAFDQAEPEVVYHLAAEFGRHNGEQFYEDLWRTGTVGTRNVLELCEERGARLLFASSSEIYGEAEADVLSESLTLEQPMWPQNDYAVSKWANEQQIRNFKARHGTDATILRFFNAYGPGETYHAFRSVVALFCHKALRGDPLPVFKGYHRTFMFISDFIPTLANVCEREFLPEPIYNIGGTDYRSVEDLARIVLTEVKGMYLSFRGNGLGVQSSDIELIPEDRHNVRNKRPDITLARRDLDHDPTITLEEGVPQTVEWMREAETVPTAS